MTGREIHWSTATPCDDEDLELLAHMERAMVTTRSGRVAARSRQMVARLQTIRLVEDQQRFVSATLLLRRAVGAAVLLDPRAVEVDLRCRTHGRHHGKPEVPGAGL